MKRRIEFNAWGRGDFDTPSYALVEIGTPVCGAVAAAIARKNGLGVATLRPDGWEVDRSDGRERRTPHWVATLGRRCGHGWTPVAEVWFSVPSEGYYAEGGA